MGLTWYLETAGTAVTNGSLGVGVYYAEIPVGPSGLFALELDWNNAIIGSVTLEATNSRTPTAYAVSGQNSWKTRPQLGSVTIAGGSASGVMLEPGGIAATRWRARINVTQAGVITANSNSR